jgi:hypothetical protein
VRAPWTSASFLLYAGGLVIFVATLALLATLGSDYGAAAFVGWTALVLAVLMDLAFGARAVGRPLAAGLFALSTVVALAVFVGALEEWAGWLAHTDSPFAGFHVDHFAIELTLVVGAVAARNLFRFPLLVLLAAGSAWFFVTDLLSNGGNWSAVVTLFYGLVAMLVGLGADRIYGFWVQVVAGLTICSAPGSEGRATPCSGRSGSFSSRRTSSSNGFFRSTSPSSARSRRAASRGPPRSRSPSTGSC